LEICKETYRRVIIVKIKVERVDKDLELPAYEHIGEDVGMDLKSRESTVLESGEYKIVKTGIKIAIPEGYAGYVNPRSGLAYKKGITVLNSDGVIDPGYRGEVGVILINHSDEDFKIERGDRIAQLIVEKYEVVEWEEVDDLDETVRGAGGFGHTGK
jgi:dUTP pyrophosphatase